MRVHTLTHSLTLSPGVFPVPQMQEWPRPSEVPSSGLTRSSLRFNRRPRVPSLVRSLTHWADDCSLSDHSRVGTVRVLRVHRRQSHLRFREVTGRTRACAQRVTQPQRAPTNRRCDPPCSHRTGWSGAGSQTRGEGRTWEEGSASQMQVWPGEAAVLGGP